MVTVPIYCRIEACPYGARFFHPLRKAGEMPENDTIGKCTFCSHRIDHGVVPSCVNTCQGRARIFGDLNDPQSEVSRLLKENNAEVLLPERGTKPKSSRQYSLHASLDEHKISGMVNTIQISPRFT